MLPYELEPVISQEFITGSMKINPYCAYDPIPSDLIVTLNVDRWTETISQWLSPVTNIYYAGYSSRATETQTVSSRTTAGRYMRQMTQKFVIEGLKPGEKVQRILFNGIDVTSSNK